jgi:hypothetical protein
VKNPRQMPARNNIGDDAPLRLAVATIGASGASMLLTASEVGSVLLPHPVACAAAGKKT